MTASFDLVIRRFEVDVGNQNDIDFQPSLDRVNIGPLFIQEKRRDIHWNLSMYRGTVLLHCLFLNNAEDVQCRGFSPANVSGAVAPRTCDVASLPK